MQQNQVQIDRLNEEKVREVERVAREKDAEIQQLKDEKDAKIEQLKGEKLCLQKKVSYYKLKPKQADEKKQEQKARISYLEDQQCKLEEQIANILKDEDLPHFSENDNHKAF